MGITSDKQPDQTEIKDNVGSTEGFSGTATTSVANIPSIAGNIISGFMFQVTGSNVQISADGGTTFFDLPKNATGFKDVKGEITQLQIKTSSGSAPYSLWVDFEDV